MKIGDEETRAFAWGYDAAPQRPAPLKEAAKPKPSLAEIVQKAVDAIEDDAHETTSGYYKHTIFLRGEAERIIRTALSEYADALKEQK